jgi:hypothetical protein
MIASAKSTYGETFTALRAVPRERPTGRARACSCLAREYKMRPAKCATPAHDLMFVAGSPSKQGRGFTTNASSSAICLDTALFQQPRSLTYFASLVKEWRTVTYGTPKHSPDHSGWISKSLARQSDTGSPAP